jgi:YHS domain-containing protein
MIGRKTLLAWTVTGVVGLALAGCGKSDSSSAESAAPAAPPPAEAVTAEPAAATNFQTTCPIREGRKIDRSIFVDYQGKRVYFCCHGCPAEFNKDPARYIKAMEDKGIVLDKTPDASK